MSYLDVLMQNGAPDEGENSCVFQKHHARNDVVVVQPVDTPEEKPKNDKVRKKDFKNKNSLRKGPKPKKFNKNKDSTPKDPKYREAFEKAQELFLKKCRPNKDEDAIISQSILYICNWQGYSVKVDLSQDNILVNLDDKEYNFSKKRFMENKFFQRMVIDDYVKAYSNVYIRFFPTRNKDDTYTILVKGGKR